MAYRCIPAAGLDVRSELHRFTEQQALVMMTYTESLNRSRDGTITQLELADTIERDVLPPWRAARRRLDVVASAPADNRDLMVKLTKYAALRQQSWELLVECIRRNDVHKARQHRTTWDAAEQLAREFSQD